MKKIITLLLLLLTSLANSQSITIGTFNVSTSSSGSDPIDGAFQSFVYQSVYTAAELNASLTAGDIITGLGYSIVVDFSGGVGNLSNYTIKLAHTSATDASAHITATTTTVKNPFVYNPTVTVDGVFDMITFDTNFVWNGTDNILVELCSGGPNTTSSTGRVRATSMANGSRNNRTNGLDLCGTTTTTANTNRPVIRFNYTDVSPCAAPTALTATYLSSTSATLSWTSSETNAEVVFQLAALGAPGVANDTGVNVTGNSYIATGISAPNTYEYYVRNECTIGSVFSGWAGPFTYIAPLPNDDCTGATSLTVGTSYGDSNVLSTNVSATNSSQAAPTCGGYSGGDVWFSATIPATGNLTIETGIDTTTLDTAIAAYSGTCATLTQIDCNDEGIAITPYSQIILTGRTSGEVIFIRVFEYFNNNFQSFKIAAFDTTLGNNEFNKENPKLNVYPNPVKDILNITNVENIKSISVYNLLGQQVLNNYIENTKNATINMSSLNNGSYLVKIVGDNLTKTIKVIKR